MKRKGKRLLSLALALSLSLGGTGLSASADCIDLDPTPPPFPPYTDVTWYPGYTPFLLQSVKLGLFSGTSASTFASHRKLTRGEAAQVLMRLFEKQTGLVSENSPSDIFEDVPSSMYCAKAVEWACRSGLMSGVGKGKFAPNRRVTSGEMAVVFHKYLQLVEKDGLYRPWKDFDTINCWFPSWCYDHMKAISGYEIIDYPGCLDPTVGLDRQEATVWFVKLYEKATFPVDGAKTPRAKYVYEEILPDPEPEPDPDPAPAPDPLPVPDDFELAPMSSDRGEAYILTSYEDYTKLLADRQQNKRLFTKVPQPRDREVSEEDFGEHNLLVIDLVETGLSFDCEFGELSIEGSTAKAIVTQSGLNGYKPNTELSGVLFFILVPKDVDTAELTRLTWTVEGGDPPGQDLGDFTLP